MCPSLYALLLRTLVIDLHAKNQHNICKGIETDGRMTDGQSANLKSPSASPVGTNYEHYEHSPDKS